MEEGVGAGVGRERPDLAQQELAWKSEVELFLVGLQGGGISGFALILFSRLKLSFFELPEQSKESFARQKGKPLFQLSRTFPRADFQALLPKNRPRIESIGDLVSGDACEPLAF